MGNFSDYSDVEIGAVGAGTSGAVKWPQFHKKTTHNGFVALIRYTRIFGPTLVNEANVSWSHRPEIGSYSESELKKNLRSTVGFNVPQFNPGGNPLGVVPNATFGGVTNPAEPLVEGRFPLFTTHDIFNFSNTVTKTAGAHTVKAGIYTERIWRNASDAVTFNGSVDFGRNVNNPLDTGYAYSNAVLGVFNAYTETSNRPFGHYRLNTVEWFVQDNWKVTRRLTLDYGMRFSWFPPLYERDNQVAGFAPALYNPAQRMQLIGPAMVDGRRVGVHPVTGQVYNAALIGAIAPGVGNSANGIALPAQDSSYPRSLIKDRGIHFAPRFGFAYDPFGKGKTALRGGFGMFYNREHLDAVLNPFSSQAPLVQNPVVNFGTLATLSNSTGLLFPTAMLGIDRAGNMPTVMNYSFSVQHNVGFGTVVDVGYVGSLGRHLMWGRNLNAIPFGANFDPKNADPTRNRGGPAAGVPAAHHGLHQYHHARVGVVFHLPLDCRRRPTAASRADCSSAPPGPGPRPWTSTTPTSNTVSSLVSPTGLELRSRGASTAPTWSKINWVWDVPTTPWKNPVSQMVLNHWQISGIASFISGTPLGIGVQHGSGHRRDRLPHRRRARRRDGQPGARPRASAPSAAISAPTCSRCPPRAPSATPPRRSFAAPA